MNVPSKPGFYWAKWMIADDHLPDTVAPFKTWEPVEVYLHDFLEEPSEYLEEPSELRVWTTGTEHSQSLDCFHWGDKLIPPVDKTAALRDARRVQERAEALKRYNDMSPDQREEFLQAKRREK